MSHAKSIISRFTLISGAAAAIAGLMLRGSLRRELQGDLERRRQGDQRLPVR